MGYVQYGNPQHLVDPFYLRSGLHPQFDIQVGKGARQKGSSPV